MNNFSAHSYPRYSLNENFSKKKSAPFIKLSRAEIARRLARERPLAFLIYTVAATHSKWGDSGYSFLEQGEAIIKADDFGLTPRQFRRECDYLVAHGHWKIVHRGRKDQTSRFRDPVFRLSFDGLSSIFNCTIVKILDSGVCDLNLKENFSSSVVQRSFDVNKERSKEYKKEDISKEKKYTKKESPPTVPIATRDREIVDFFQLEDEEEEMACEKNSDWDGMDEEAIWSYEEFFGVPWVPSSEKIENAPQACVSQESSQVNIISNIGHTPQCSVGAHIKSEVQKSHPPKPTPPTNPIEEFDKPAKPIPAKYTRKEKPKASPKALELNHLFYESLKKNVPHAHNYPKTEKDFNGSARVFDRMLETRLYEDIKRAIVFAHTDWFWKKIIHQPYNLFGSIGKILTALDNPEKSSPQKKKEDSIPENKQLAETAARILRSPTYRIEILSTRVEIIANSGQINPDVIDYRDCPQSFKTQLLHILKKRGFVKNGQAQPVGTFHRPNSEMQQTNDRTRGEESKTNFKTLGSINLADVIPKYG